MITKKLAVAIILVLITALPAAAVPTEFDQFDSKVERIAPAFDGYPRGLCVCQDANLYEHTAGELRSSQIGLGPFIGVAVSCQVPIFNPGSEERSGTYSCQQFVPLPR